MKITKSQLKQIIQEELKDVQEQQSMMPMSREEIADELATSSKMRRAVGKSVRGHFQCDTRVPLHMREECHEAVDRGETFWPDMPPGERSQPRYFTPSERPRMSYERPTMPPGVQGDGTIAPYGRRLPREPFYEFGASGTFKENKMKITKSQLKQIVQEELENVLSEKHDCAKEHPDMTHEAYMREQQQMMLEREGPDPVNNPICAGARDFVKTLEEGGQMAQAEDVREMFPSCFA